MATLNENIAKTKENFRNIRNAINVVGDAVAYEPLINEPVEEYPTRLNEVVDQYGLIRYEDGYADGKADGGGVDLSKCKYIEKQATGKVIALNDVSEVYHKVKVFGNGKVDVYGKNLLPFPYYETRAEYNGVTFTANEDGILTLNGTATGNIYYKLAVDIPLVEGNYKLTGCPKNGGWGSYILYADDGGSSTVISDSGNGGVKSFSNGVYRFYLFVSAGYTCDNLIFKPMLSLTDSDLSWESYKKPQTITATPNGTEVNSICPNMTFLADTDITVDYYGSFGMAEKELAMWNGMTSYGQRESYNYSLAYSDYSGCTIPEGLFKPKSIIGQMCYSYSGVELPRGIDCSEFNTSQTTQSYHCYTTFAYANKIKHIYDMGIPAVRFYAGTYKYCTALESIEIIRSNEDTKFESDCFQNDSNLTHCIFSGVIASDINLQWSPLLDEESLISLVDCLKQIPDGGEQKTITLHPTSWEKLASIPLGDGDYSYAQLVDFRNWLRA